VKFVELKHLPLAAAMIFARAHFVNRAGIVDDMVTVL
jgi:hypothetical protein